MQVMGAHHPGSAVFNSTGSNFTVRLCREMVAIWGANCKAATGKIALPYSNRADRIQLAGGRRDLFPGAVCRRARSA
jgi:hypothetical protein